MLVLLGKRTLAFSLTHFAKNLQLCNEVQELRKTREEYYFQEGNCIILGLNEAENYKMWLQALWFK